MVDFTSIYKLCKRHKRLSGFRPRKIIASQRTRKDPKSLAGIAEIWGKLQCMLCDVVMQ